MSQVKQTTLDKRRVLWPLQALNFFMADMQAGVGPFLGVFLLAHGWQSGLIGSVMTIGGVAGMLMTAPAGALIDATKRKRTYVVIAALFTTLASGIILLSQEFWLVSVSQVATAVAGSAIGPGVVGITLGLVRQKGFNRQNGYNQAYNHAGNVVGAGLSGYLGMRFGMPAVFILAAVFGVLAIVSVLLIPARAIDDEAARGLPDKHKNDDSAGVTGVQVLLTNKPLLILAAALACFHLGNGAMLPLYGLAAATHKAGNATGFVAMTIIIAQLTMIVVSLVAMRMAEKRGYWLVMLVSFLALPLRGFIAACLTSEVVSGADPGWRRGWSAKRGCAGAGSAPAQRNGTHQHRAGRCHDRAGAGRIPEPGHWGLDGAAAGLCPHVSDTGKFRFCVDPALAGVCQRA